jgi:plastocyanin
MFRPTIALYLAVLALVLIATGCGGSAGSDVGGSGAAAPVHGAATKPAEAASSAKPVEVDVKDNVFAPAAIHAKVGQKITWNVRGQIAHTVTATEGATFDSGALPPGASFSYTTKKAGTISYLCSFHQGMTGLIVVE